MTVMFRKRMDIFYNNPHSCSTQDIWSWEPNRHPMGTCSKCGPGQLCNLL